MYEKITAAEILNFQKTNTSPTEAQITLKDIVVFYENQILPYRYTYTCEHELKISFIFEDENLCHLLFGTIDKHYHKRKEYVGKLGYNNIKNGIVTLENLPSFIRSKSIHRILDFILISKIISKPTVIIFNNKLVKQDGNKYLNSDIKAKFLLAKQLTVFQYIHLFLNEVGPQKKLAPISFFPNKDENYIREQTIFKVVGTPIIEKIDKSDEVI